MAACDAEKLVQSCPSGEPVTCGVFHYTDRDTRQRVHAKSCVWTRYCGNNDTFCREILGGAADCYLECCHTELCNYEETGPTDDDWDDDDCSWIDAGSARLASLSAAWACALGISLAINVWPGTNPA